MAKQQGTNPVNAAREVARAEVARRWPELAGVEPTMTLRPARGHDAAAPGRVAAGAGGAAPAEPPRREGAEPAEYTFTFAGHLHTPDGYVLARIARVTVDSARRVVKATTSK
jgi:hypothetical protein